MSFDTQKRKFRKIWEDSASNDWHLHQATLRQDHKEQVIKMVESTINQFSKFTVYNSEWTPLDPQLVDDNGDYTHKGIMFDVVITVPESWIPYLKFNVAYRYTGSENPFENTSVYIPKTCFIQSVEDDTFKKVSHNISFIQTSYGFPWKDYEVKLFYTLFNPTYITVS